ncbi:hypothetical protein IGI37_000456 [Enterococcus sp. AZ194]|uniref:ROK family protein n=1 Tax=Enterococcus sp. AZ194 TaxID=2774629 RepID=UPI003F264E27
MTMISMGLDVGGTYTKGAVFYEGSQNEHSDVYYYESKSQGNKNELLENFVSIILDLLGKAAIKGSVKQIGLAFPGPFDYERGISLIQGLRKFEHLYEVNLKEALLEKLIENDGASFKETNLFFINDAQAFAVGENRLSKVTKGAYFTLGTGLGSTFIEQGQPVKGEYGIPVSGMIYDVPFFEGLIDEYLCEKGLVTIATAFGLKNQTGKELFLAAEEGQLAAQEAFHVFGRLIGLAIRPYVTEMKPSEIVFGGQVSKGFAYFSQGIREVLSEVLELSQVVIRASSDTTLRTLEGLGQV